MNIKSKITANRLISLLLFIVILVVLNLIAKNVFARADLTENRIYTLTDATKDILKGLDDRITIRAYFSEGLPAQYAEYRQIIKDKLDEYKIYAGDNLQYEFIDPSDSVGKQRAQSDGVPQARINVFENDQYTSRNVFLGLVVIYQNEKEIIPIVQNLSGFEYELTRAILKVSSPETDVGYLTSNGTLEMTKDVPSLIRVLRSQYTVSPVDLTRGSIPPNISTLIILKPTEKFTDSELYAIDQFVMKGGKLAVFFDKIDADMETGKTQKLDIGLDKLLDNYHLGVNDDIVLDRNHVQVTVPQTSGSMVHFARVDYPFIPIITNFDKDNPIVKKLENMNLIITSSIDTSMLPNSGLKYSILARSSNYAYLMKSNYTISPNFQITPDMYNASNVPLAVSAHGKFDSYFANTEFANSDSKFKSESSETKIVLVGDGDFVIDKFLGRAAAKSANMIFFSNIIDWLSLKKSLISIRSREVTYRPIQKIVNGKIVEFTNAEKSRIKLMNILYPVSIVLIFGIIYFIIIGIKKKSEVKL
ncbi:Gldg family protein [bacterium]|nr:Gldg family protein [bacterium]